MTQGPKRITLEEASRLYPDEWIIFAEPKIDSSTTEFVDGVVFFHGKDQDEAFEKAEEISGSMAIRFTGEPRYRNVTFESLDAVHKSAA